MSAYVPRRTPAAANVDISDNSARSGFIERVALEAYNIASAQRPKTWAAPAVGDPPAFAPLKHDFVADVWQTLNSLRVMAQYSKILGSMSDRHPFLHGHPTTCVAGLEWLSRFLQPIQQPAEDVAHSIEQSVEAFRIAQDAVSMSKGEATFLYHKGLTCSDRDVTRVLVSQHFPAMSCREYDVDVCAFMLANGSQLGYDDWLTAFPSWRDTGLFFPLALSAVYMPSIASWLPEAKHSDTPFAIMFSRCLSSLGRPGFDHVSPLKALAAVWAADSTGASQVVAGTLDRVAVLMGIKSNGRPGKFSLAAALAAFPRSFAPDAEADMHEANYHAWHTLRSAVESTFPPSLLLVPCVRPKRPTWGYPRLTIEVATEGVLPSVRFAESCLHPVDPATACGAQSPVPSYHRDCLLNQTPGRIQDVLWRLGEIVTSPDVALCMLQPRAAKLALDGVQAKPGLSRLEIMQKMPGAGGAPFTGLASDCAAAPSTRPDYLEYTRALVAIVPHVYVTHFTETQSILMWRLDMPSRAIIYLGSGADFKPLSESQHHIHKILVNSKVPQRPVGGIVQVPTRSDESTLRACLLHFAVASLLGHPSNTVLVKAGEASPDEEGGASPIGAKQAMPLTCTTLAESLACFGLCPPSNISTCPIGGSCAWKENGIDPRYAERQLAENGARFRDWAAMHAGRGGTQQSRLASHFIEYDTLYTTRMPWVQDDLSVKWVRVASTRPPESKTLHGKNLRQAVESRYLHDLRMLPASDSRPKIERSNAEIYAEEDGAKVAVAYAPSGQDRLEFMEFECADI
jgi:hypothetical protein